MSTELDDVEEFAEAADSYDYEKSQSKTLSVKQSPSIAQEKAEEKPEPGQVSQYALHGPGYRPTTPTIPSLPSGCYDIISDSSGLYCVPVAAPSGLLLELPEMRSEEVINIVDNFWNSEKDYKEGNDFVIGGAIYKAGIMLWGPPGSGKSCTIKIVSRKLISRGGTVFYASTSPHAVQRFLEQFSLIEKNRKCIVILEDIDTLIELWGESPYLEMLDSAKTIDNVLFIATTNYPDRLDPRVYNRPGRFSSVLKVGLPGKNARKAFLCAVLKNHRDVEYIVENSAGFSIDHLSALCNAVYREKKPLEKEIKRLRTLFKIPKNDDREMGIGASIGEKDYD